MEIAKVMNYQLKYYNTIKMNTTYIVNCLQMRQLIDEDKMLICNLLLSNQI